MDKTLLKGLAVLEAIADQQGRPRIIADIARDLDLTPSNVHRALQTLAQAKFVAKDEVSGSYHATMKMFELGAKQLQRFDVRRFAPPFMRQLAEDTGETVHLSMLEGMDVVYIDKIDSPQPVRAYTAIGGRAPAHAVATGKALLARQDERYVDLHARQLERFTPRTITSVAALKKELVAVQKAGYAINRGEWRDSVGGVAVAVFAGPHQPVSGIGISGPLDRLSLARMRELGPRIKECAQQISSAMGYVDR